jgi:hypothetical protein
MLYCSNSKGAAMEPKLREDRTASDRQAPERSAPNTDKAAFTAPFVSEGLEQVRDSHC